MAQMKRFSIVVAACQNNGIGVNNQLPWRLRKEMNYFTRITSASCEGKQNAVVMGRKTWDSIPDKFRPLPNRVNVVLSNSLGQVPDGVYLFKSLKESLTSLSQNDSIDQIFIIGGAQVYKEAIEMNECEKVYLTKIDAHFECDTFFPEVDLTIYKPICLPEVPTEEQQESNIKYKFFVYQRSSLA